MEKGLSITWRLIWLLIALIAGLVFIIFGCEYLIKIIDERGPIGHDSYHLGRLYRFIDIYLEAKYIVLHKIGIKWLVTILSSALIIITLGLRKWVKFYHYKILPLLLGHTFRAESDEFRHGPFDLSRFIKKKADDEHDSPAALSKIEEKYIRVKARYKRIFGTISDIPLIDVFYKKGLNLIERLEKRAFDNHSNKTLYRRTFLGLNEKERPFSLNEDQRSKHLEVIGKSGTGKTKSVLAPVAMQDMMVGKSVIIVNGKGDQNFPSLAYAAAEAAGREGEFYFLNLAFPDRSHTYNPLYLGSYGDPLVVADRMFSVLGYKNEYYRDVAFNFFKNLVCIMADTGKPFNLQDIYICVCSKEAREYVCKMSSDKRTKKLLDWSVESLDRQKEDTLSGLKTKLEFYCNDLLNAYNPDIIVEDIIEKDQIVFLSLNINMMPTLAPAVARLFLRELQQHIGGREADSERNQNPCSIILDEFSTFIYKHFHVAISQFREGNAQLTFAHQSGSDLNLFEKELGSVVWDNAQTKIVLAQDDSLQCQKIAEMIGTQKVIERTERYNRGFMFMRTPTFESSNKYVDEFLFHPNKIKKLEPCGQGYVLTTKEQGNGKKRSGRDILHPELNEKESIRITGVNFGMFPDDFYLQPVVKRKPTVDGLNLTKLFLDKDYDGVKEGELKRKDELG